MKIFILAFFLAVTFFQSLHGAFSALIMLVLCVLCSTLALSHFEWLHNTMLASFMPDYGQAVALAALFVIPVGLLRVGIDRVISGNMVLPTLVDRIGAPLLGIGTGLIVSGMIAMVFQLLPFDAGLLGFQRIIATHNGEPISPATRLNEVPISPDIEFTRDNLWLSPDGLTVSLASALSQNVFSARPSFGEVHPDFLEELHWRRFGTQRESRDWVAPDALSVREAKVLGANELWVYRVPEDQTFGATPTPVPDTTRPPDAGNHYVAVVVTLRNDKDTTDAQDTHRFRGGQFRLVCRDPRTGRTEHFPMTGICYKPGVLGDDGKWQCFHQFRGTIINNTGDGLGVAFEVPERLEPWFIEYKASARAAVPPIKVPGGAVRPPTTPTSITGATPSGSTPAERPASPPPSRPTPTRADDVAPPSGGSAGGRDRISGRYVREGVSRFSDELPVPISEGVLIEQGSDLTDGKLDEGHIAVAMSAVGAEEADAIRSVVVPEGKRLLQLWVDRTEAQSIFGRSIQFTRETLAQFTVTDAEGEEYHRIGELRIAEVEGRETLEIQYWPNAEMPERCIRDFRTVKNNHMTGEYSLVYFYLIPDGRRPERFHVGAGKSREIGRIEGE